MRLSSSQFLGLTVDHGFENSAHRGSWAASSRAMSSWARSRVALIGVRTLILSQASDHGTYGKRSNETPLRVGG